MNNPWMSLWMSSANAVMGSMLGQTASVGKKHFEVISVKAAEDMMSFWMTAWAPPPALRRRKIR